MEYIFRNAIACSPQSWNWLENREGEDNKVFWRKWKAVKTQAEEIGIEKTKERRGKRGRDKKRESKERKKRERETKRGKNNEG